MAELSFRNGMFRLSTADSLLKAQSSHIQMLRGWSESYELATSRNDEARLFSIGRDMSSWLKANGFAEIMTASGSAIFSTPAAPNADERVFLDAPWEILADLDSQSDVRFLAERHLTPYQPARRVGRGRKPIRPSHNEVSLLFMAAAPHERPQLSYETEEAAIFEAMRRLEVTLLVEDGGTLHSLEERLAAEAHVEALHLSCHGIIANGEPCLVFENDLGSADYIGVGTLANALSDQPPLLVFVSACRTASEQPGIASPLAINLVQNVPNVLGWNGSVHDADAILFAKEFYREIALGRSAPYAAWRARHQLLTKRTLARQTGALLGLHWHLARVFLGDGGNGPLREKGRPRRPQSQPAGAPVVGRRAEVQSALRAFESGQYAGILIRGVGGIGKSDLARWISCRLPHYAAVSVTEPCDATQIFEEIVDKMPARRRAELRKDWSSKIEDPESFKDALESILQDAASKYERNVEQPVVLVLNGVEQILDRAAPSTLSRRPSTANATHRRHFVKSPHRAVLAAVVRAFDAAIGRTASRLILTSRYAFSLPSGVGDLADRLRDIQLAPIDLHQRIVLKELQIQRAQHSDPLDEASHRLIDRSIQLANGNPRLQSLLINLVLQDRDSAEQEIAALQAYFDSGLPPKSGAAGEFFDVFKLNDYRGNLSPDELRQARSALLFEDNVPASVMRAAGTAAGVADPGAAVAHLIDLACFDVSTRARDGRQQPELALNALVRPIFNPLPNAAAMAKAVLSDFRAVLMSSSTPHRRSALPSAHTPTRSVEAQPGGGAEERAVELVRLALIADDTRSLTDWSIAALNALEHRGDLHSAAEFGNEAIKVLDRTAHHPSPELLAAMAGISTQLGRMEAAGLQRRRAITDLSRNLQDLIKRSIDDLHWDIAEVANLIKRPRSDDSDGKAVQLRSFLEDQASGVLLPKQYLRLALDLRDHLRARGAAKSADLITNAFATYCSLINPLDIPNYFALASGHDADQYRFRKPVTDDELTTFQELSDAEADITQAHPGLLGEKRRIFYRSWFERQNDSFLILDRKDRADQWQPVAVSILLPLTQEGRELFCSSNIPTVNADNKSSGLTPYIATSPGARHFLYDTLIVRKRPEAVGDVGDSCRAGVSVRENIGRWAVSLAFCHLSTLLDRLYSPVEILLEPDFWLLDLEFEILGFARLSTSLWSAMITLEANSRVHEAFWRNIAKARTFHIHNGP
jgi:hypothetical protein